MWTFVIKLEGDWAGDNFIPPRSQYSFLTQAQPARRGESGRIKELNFFYSCLHSSFYFIAHLSTPSRSKTHSNILFPPE